MLRSTLCTYTEALDSTIQESPPHSPSTGPEVSGYVVLQESALISLFEVRILPGKRGKMGDLFVWNILPWKLDFSVTLIKQLIVESEKKSSRKILLEF